MMMSSMVCDFDLDGDFKIYSAVQYGKRRMFPADGTAV
jgi:hypothetical protein